MVALYVIELGTVRHVLPGPLGGVGHADGGNSVSCGGLFRGWEEVVYPYSRDERGVEEEKAVCPLLTSSHHPLLPTQ